jgi:hypothetical protein
MTESEWMGCTAPGPLLAHLEGTASNRKLRLFACACCRSIWNLLDTSCRTAIEVAECYADGLASYQELDAALWRAVQSMGRLPPLPSMPHGFDPIERFLFPMREAPRFNPRTWKQHIESAGFGRGFEEDLDTIRKNLAERWPYRATLSSAGSPPRYCRTSYGAHVVDACMSAAHARGGIPAEDATEWCAMLEQEARQQVALLRDIAGNPFQPVFLAESWLTTAGAPVGELARTAYGERRFDILPVLADALEEAGCADVAILAHCREPATHTRGCWVLDLLLGKT